MKKSKNSPQILKTKLMKVSKPKVHLEILEKMESDYQKMIKDIFTPDQPFVISFDDDAAEERISFIEDRTERFINLCKQYQSIFKTKSTGKTINEVARLLQGKSNIASEIKTMSLLEANAKLETSSSHSIKVEKLIEITNFPDSVHKLINDLEDFVEVFIREENDIVSFISVNDKGEISYNIPKSLIETIYSNHSLSIAPENLPTYLQARELCKVLNYMATELRTGYTNYPDMFAFRELIDIEGLSKTHPNIFHGYTPNLKKMAKKTLKHKVEIVWPNQVQ